MKKAISVIIKCILFFMSWALLISFIPSPESENGAVWRLWAELIPLLLIIGVTFIFWLIEKRKIKLHIFENPVKSIITGILTGVIWLFIPVSIMYLMGNIHFAGKNEIDLFYVWLLAAFLNVIMQELLIRGYMYSLIKQKYNPLAAVIVTTAIFTALHGGAFESGIIPVLSVLTTSLLLTSAFEFTGSLITPIIMHGVWNSVGALVLGGVSLADDYPNLFITSFSGNEIISGGACKIEGSIFVLIINIILIGIFMLLKRKNELDNKTQY